MYALDGTAVTISLPNKIRTYVRGHFDELPASYGKISGNIRGANANDVESALQTMIGSGELIAEGRIVRELTLEDYF